MTAAAFLEFRDTASPGQSLVYYRGFLARADELLLKEAVGAAYLTGWFDLTQRRHGPDDYTYIITRRAKRDPMLRYWRGLDDKQSRQSAYHRPRSAGYAAGVA